MLNRYVAGLVAAALAAVGARPAHAGLFHRDGCDPCVGERVTETRKVKVCEYKEEIRERKVTVYERIAQTMDVTREVCVWEPETRTKLVKYYECKPVWKEETREYTVLVPHTEKRKGTRKVCKLVETKEKRKVCVDEGCWEERCCAKKCGGCGHGCRAKRVWTPKLVEKEMEVTCLKRTWVEEPYEYCATVCKPEKRTCTVKVCHVERMEKSRECKYTVCVPKKKTETCQVTTYKCVPKEKIEKCKVLVPHWVDKEVKVEVCKAHGCKPCCPKPCCRARKVCCN